MIITYNYDISVGNGVFIVKNILAYMLNNIIKNIYTDLLNILEYN